MLTPSDPRMRELRVAAAGPADLDAKAAAPPPRSASAAAARASPPVCWRRPRRGHRFPGSHGPPEQRVNRKVLTRRYRCPAASGKNSSNRLPSRLLLSASKAPVAVRNRQTNPAAPGGNDQTNPTASRRSRSAGNCQTNPTALPPLRASGKNTKRTQRPGAWSPPKNTKRTQEILRFQCVDFFRGCANACCWPIAKALARGARGERGACGSWINSPALDFRPLFGPPGAGMRTCEARRQVVAGTCFAVRATKRTQDIGLNQWVSDLSGRKSARHGPAHRDAVRRERAMVAEGPPTSAVRMPVMAQPEAVLVTAPAGARSCAAAWHGPRCGRPAARTRRARAAA